MKNNFNNIFNKFINRDWILKDEGKLTYVQLFGFLLITLGVIYFASFLLPNGIIDIFPMLKLDENPESSEVPVAFFTTILGIAFAFPDMLKGQTKEVSTMRIIVFMFANVICMLLLKIGWDKNSLGEIGLDGYWMGVIAFLFGAKATQSYFENANKINTKVPTLSKRKVVEVVKIEESKNFEVSPIAIAQIARVQNEGKLYSRFGNIQSISDTLKAGESCLTIYISDDNLNELPSFVPVKLNETYSIMVQTEIITNSSAAITHIGQATDELSDSINPQAFGSICCLLNSIDNATLKFIVTAGHNFTNGDFKSMRGFVFGNDQRNVLVNSDVKGKLF